MKRSKRIMLVTCFFGLLFSAAYGQTTLQTSGREDYTGTYKDYILPQQSLYKAVRFRLKGGDGGTAQIDDSSGGHKTKTCKAYGGGGAIVEALFELGSGSGQLQPGSTIRFIAGGKGGRATLATIVGGTAAGGGGGGTAVLYQQKGSNQWTILAVAGGGGGAYQGSFFASCKDGSSGGQGRTVFNGGAGKGNLSGNGGGNGIRIGGEGGGSIGDGDLSGGGGYSENGKGGSSTEGLSGAWTGGKGGSGQRGGGFGFGGGGAADESGGGGGGYYGGGGGGMTGGGGGGGSYVNPAFALKQILLEFDMEGLIGENGFIDYELTNSGISLALAPLGSDKDLHVKWISDDTPDDTPVLLRDYDKTSPTDNERWYFDDLTGTFRLFKDPRKCLDLSQMSINGATVYIHHCNLNANQRWIYAGSQIRLQHDQSKCLILKNNNLENGNTPTVWDCNTVPLSQSRWAVNAHTYSRPTAGAPSYANRDWYRYDLAKNIQLAGNNKCLENKLGQTTNGNNIQIATCTESSVEKQRWILDNSVLYLAAAPNRCLDLSASNTNNGANIQLWACNGTNAQKWIYDVARQAIRSSIDFDKCLDLSGSNTTDGSNIQLFECNGTNAQKFIIE